MSCRIPLAPFLPLMREKLEELESSNDQHGGVVFSTSPPEVLANLIGLSRHTLDRYLSTSAKARKHSDSIEFDVADRLLCRTGRVNLWRDDPELRDIYESVDLSAADDGRRRICAAPNCTSYALATRADGTCSEKCTDALGRIVPPKVRRCAVCDAELVGKQRSALTCGDLCRQVKHREAVAA